LKKEEKMESDREKQVDGDLKTTSSNNAIPAPPPDMMHRLVLEYLRHSGRTKAAACFEKEADFSQAKESPGLLQRGEIRRKLIEGDVIGATELINDLNPELLDSNEDLVFQLRLQAFVEMVRHPGYDLEKVLAFASEEFVPCPTHLLPNLEEVMALLAFENPAESPLKEVLNRREAVATNVNRAILSFQGIGEPELVDVLTSALWMNKYCSSASINSSAIQEDLSTRVSTSVEESQRFFEDYLEK